MKLPLFLQRRLTFLAISLLLVASGCRYFRPQEHSPYREIHQHARAGSVADLTNDLRLHPEAINLPDDAKETPLHLAIIGCHIEAARLLLEKGADANLRDQLGAQPLHLAASEGCLDGIRLLLDKGAHLNDRDKEKRTPLVRARQWEQPAAADLLKSRGGIE